jgi:hypothetical protein
MMMLFLRHAIIISSWTPVFSVPSCLDAIAVAIRENEEGGRTVNQKEKTHEYCPISHQQPKRPPDDRDQAH